MSEPLPPSGHAHSRLWLLLLAALAAWQAWLTLALFGGLDALADDRPLLSGRHPLHLYHGYLGARSLLERGSLSCFDPAFHAGYPKTPVFDSGSRPAELALALAGGRFCPASYKIACALLCLLVPFASYLGARGLGLARGTSVVAVLLSLAVWWGKPGREALEAGDIDLLWAAILATAQAGLLVRYHDRACPLALLGAVAAGLGGWFAHPLLMLALLPPFMAYYLAAGPKHPTAWHVPLFAGLLLAVAGNAFWLTELVSYWWVRVPPELDTPLATRSLGGVWRSVLWGGTLDRVIACALLLVASTGLVVLRLRGQRVGANLLGAMVLGTFLLSVAGLMLDVLGRLGAAQLVVPALLFACLPSACAVCACLDGLRRAGG
ncbi:MAG: hypothetical protein K2W96_16425, partial [Gemmataceae bacterium]|nr:hypothetical protein [Gemmataceae bacterium]